MLSLPVNLQIKTILKLSIDFWAEISSLGIYQFIYNKALNAFTHLHLLITEKMIGKQSNSLGVFKLIKFGIFCIEQNDWHFLIVDMGPSTRLRIVIFWCKSGTADIHIVLNIGMFYHVIIIRWNSLQWLMWFINYKLSYDNYNYILYI